MKRLTKIVKGKLVGVEWEDTEGTVFRQPPFNPRATKKIVNRLVELEDKLESGQLVELPCKVGDTVWVIDYDEEVVSYVCIGGNSSFLFLSPTIYVGEDLIAPEELCNYYVDCYMEDGSDTDVVIFSRSKCFTDKAQAEARLKELQSK